jgi:hypothetical protein
MGTDGKCMDFEYLSENNDKDMEEHGEDQAYGLAAAQCLCHDVANDLT